MSTADIIGSLLASAADALLDEPARRHALGQVKLLQAPPEVVRPAVPLLLRLLEDPAADVRRMALALVEDAGRSCPSTIPELLPALLTRLSDESAPTLKRALAAATSLLRPTLVLLLAEKDEAAAKALEPTWGHLRKLRETAGTLLNAASAADSVRTAAVKACEALVLAYTDEPEDEGTESAEGPPGADVTSGGSGWRLSALPAAAALEDGNGANRGVHVGEGGTSGGEGSGEGGNEGGGETGSEGAAAITASEESELGKRPPHPLLERAALEAEGEATLTLLETTLLAPPSATVLLVLLTSIAALARQRRVLLQRLSRTLAALSRALLERAASLAALPSHQVANAQQSLRAALLTLLKTTRAREDRAVEEELATALRHLGANEQLKHLYKLMGTEPPPLLGGGERGASESAVSGAGSSAVSGAVSSAVSSAADGSGSTKRATADGTEGGDSAFAAGPKRVKTEGAPTAALATTTTTSSGGSAAASARLGMPPRPPLLPPAELEALLSRLGPHLVAQLVIASMPWLPPRPPPPPPPPAGTGTALERKPMKLNAPIKMDAAACASLAEAALASLIGDDREAQLAARGLAEVRALLLGRRAAACKCSPRRPPLPTGARTPPRTTRGQAARRWPLLSRTRCPRARGANGAPTGGSRLVACRIRRAWEWRDGGGRCSRRRRENGGDGVAQPVRCARHVAAAAAAPCPAAQCTRRRPGALGCTQAHVRVAFKAH
jgi:hypothetical protein